MTALLENGKPIAVIGYRVQESLVHNRHIYVDDLVTDQDARGMRLGGMLLDHAKDIGRANECGKLVLGTGADNLRAQAFYRREGLKATSIGFSIKLE